MRGSGDTDAWAREALRSLVTKALTPEQLAESVYKLLKPRDAKGQLIAPKLKNDRLSVRNLERHVNPVPGASSARKNLETVLDIYYDYGLVRAEVDQFCMGLRDIKLYGIRALLKSRKINPSVSLNFRIDRDLREFVDTLVESKQFSSVDAVLTTALGLLKARCDVTVL